MQKPVCVTFADDIRQVSIVLGCTKFQKRREAESKTMDMVHQELVGGVYLKSVRFS